MAGLIESPDPNFCSKAQKRSCHWWSKAPDLKISVPSFCGIPDSRGGMSSTLCLPLGPFSFYWVASSSYDGRVCGWYYCILLSHIQLVSLVGLLFSGGRQGELIWGRGEGRGTVRSGRRRSCDQHVLYERRMGKKTHKLSEHPWNRNVGS